MNKGRAQLIPFNKPPLIGNEKIYILQSIKSYEMFESWVAHHGLRGGLHIYGRGILK